MIRSFLLPALLAWAGAVCARPIQPTPFSPIFGFLPPAGGAMPLITCPPNDTVDLVAGECSVDYTYTITVSDPNALWAQTAGLPSGSTYYPGVTTNNFIAIDPAGNTGTCSFTVTVNPVYGSLVCEDAVTVTLDSACTHQLTIAETLTAISNGCTGGLFIEVDRVPPFTGNGPWTPGSMTAADLDKTYQFRITDPSTGNRCWGNVTVADSLPPAVSCPTIAVPCALPQNLLTPDFLADSLGIAAARPVAGDNCGGALTTTYFDLLTNTACDTAHDIGAVIQRQWLVRDASDNQTVCNQNIELRRLLAEVHFPANSTTPCAAPDFSVNAHGLPYYEINGRRFDFNALPLCDMDVSFYDTLEPLCGSTQRTRRTWKLIDLCLAPSATNPRTGVQFIDAVDTVGPALNCPAVWTVMRPAPACSLSVDLPDVVLTDACSTPVSVTAFWTLGGLTQSLAGTVADSAGQHVAVLGAIADLPVGETVVSYAATDECGSTGTCAITVAVYDSVPPVAVCDSFATVLIGADGTAVLPAAVLDGGSTDACGALSFRARRLVISSCQPDTAFVESLTLCCDDPDTLQVELRVYDVPLHGPSTAPSFGAGQYASCFVQVALIDTLPPRCVAPADVELSCRFFDPAFYSTDLIGWQLSCNVDSASMDVNYAQFDTACSAGTLVRTLHVYATDGTAGSCTQQVVSTPYQDYYIKFPDDVLLTVCSATGIYGMPEIGNATCEDIQITYTDEVQNLVPDACFRILRTWYVVNNCTWDGQTLILVPNPTPFANALNQANFPGPIVSPPNTAAPWQSTVVRITPTDPQPTDYSAFRLLAGAQGGYRYTQIIRVIDQQQPEVTCPPALPVYHDVSNNDPLLWNDLTWFDPQTSSYNLAEGPSPLTIDAHDDCTDAGMSVSFQLFLDLDGDGGLETVAASNQPATLTPGFVRFGNAQTPNFLGGTLRQFDFRPVPSGQYYRFGLQTERIPDSTQGEILRVSLRWFTQDNNPNMFPNPVQGISPELPYGTHRIKWFLSDDCGNTTTCEYFFTVRDGKKPVVVCVNGISVNQAPLQWITLNASDLYLYAEDNYTPSPLLKLGVRRAGTGTGFPFDALGNLVTTVTFTCADLGVQYVDVWAIDQSGLADSCTTYVLVQDNLGVCDSTFMGQHTVATATGVGIPGVEIQLSGFSPGVPPYPGPPIETDSLGHYSLSAAFPVSSTFTVTPHKDTDPLNGVSTVDLLLISRHVLGIEPLPSPYQIIAADANRSGSVTSFDIVELRKLILGLYSELPNNESWRFVPAAWSFFNPALPFNPPFPESVSGPGLDFIGMKIGDVNNSVDPALLYSTDDRDAAVLEIPLHDRTVHAGEEFELPFSFALAPAGVQFTLEGDGVEVLDVTPGPGFDAGHFGRFAARPDVLTVAWDNPAFSSAPAEQPRFTVRLRARRDGRLRDLLAVSDAITRAEAYTDDLRTGSVVLRWNDAPDARFTLYGNVPNPFTDATSIGFYLPAASPVELTIFNAAGQVAHRQSADFPAGEHFIKIENKILNASGLYFYKIETAWGNAAGKMKKG